MSFVADARPSALDANRSALKSLAKDLAGGGSELATLPLVVQLDTSRAKAPADADAFVKSFTTDARAIVPANASNGQGVFAALKAAAKLALLEQKKAPPEAKPER